MKWIGLTGGIGSGKSQVAAIIRSLGYPVIDADQMARQVVMPGTTAYKGIVQAFGRGILNPDQTLNRKLLKQAVFSSSEKLATLERLVHPEVKKLTQAEREKYQKLGIEAAFYDVPLLFEKKLESQFDLIALVYSPEALMLKRVMKRDLLDENLVIRMIGTQMPIEEKRPLADYIIRNTGTLDELEAEVTKFLKKCELALPGPLVASDQS